ncbi:MAG: SBBP repeat-containing protein [Ferruginibacter sp.]
MKKIYYILTSAILCLFISHVVTAQVQEVWAVPHTYSDMSLDAANVNAVDQYGNVYVAGISHQTSGEDYVTIIKYDAYGVEKWNHVFGGGYENYYMRPVELIVKNNNVYLLTTSFSTNNVFKVVKYDLDGHFRWLTKFSGVVDNHYGKAYDMDVDPIGNVYVAGYEAAESSLDPTTLVSIYFTVKLEGLEGEQQWVRTYNGTDPGNGSNLAYAIVADPSGNTYVTGRSQFNGKLDIATIKYNTAGVRQWVQRYNGTADGDDVGYDIALDAGNNIYVTGYTTAANNNKNYVTLKYNSDGEQQWVQTYNGFQEKDDVANALVVDWAGNIYVTGNSHVISDLDHYEGVTIKYNTNGTAFWTSRTDIYPEDIAVDVENNVYIAGGNISGSKIETIRLNSGTGALHWTKEFDNRRGDFFFQFHPKVSIAVFGNSNANVFVCGGFNPDGNDPADFISIRYSQCNIICPPNITVNNDAGKCNAVVNFNPVTYSGDCGSSFTYSHNTGSEFPVGTTTVTATSDATGATCSFTITVVDNQLPVFTNCPASKTASTSPNVCYATAASLNAGTATATDNCSVTVTGVRSDGLSLSANFLPGTTTITWTAVDASGNSATCIQTITVVDDQFPVITGEAASTVILSPPNHLMRDVAISYTATDNCPNVVTTLSITSNEPINGTGDGDTDPDYIVVDNHNVKLRAERAANGTGRIYIITIRAVDSYGNVTLKTVEVRVPHDIKIPNSGHPFVVGSTVNFQGEFWDKLSNRHTAKWLLDGVVSANGTVVEPTANQNGKVTGSYKFNTAGVYKLQMNVIDQTGVVSYANTQADLDAIVVIYDPNGGYTYGGGWYPSPTGAVVDNPSATGKASFGFAINYRNAARPKGETQFEFKVGNFEFNALNFEYLVVSGAKAQFKGTGKIIGGQSGLNFIMTVMDGALDGSGIDKIRLKIFKNNGQVMYDNQPGAGDAENPTMAVGANSIIFIQGTQGNQPITSSMEKQVAHDETANDEEVAKALSVIAFPNPSSKNFMLKIRSNDEKKPIQMQVTDAQGRAVETHSSLKSGAVVSIGSLYKTGSYYVKVFQGTQQQTLVLVKLSE